MILREDGRYSAVLCSGNICESMLVRLLACGDRSIRQVNWLGIWNGRTDKELSESQRRINSRDYAGWVTQVWQVRLADGQTAIMPDTRQGE